MCNHFRIAFVGVGDVLDGMSLLVLLVHYNYYYNI
jgi:hypothetical protein